MKIAAFNIENLFDRAKVFNTGNQGTSDEVLDAHASLNKLFEEEVYTEQIQQEMLENIETLGLLRSDEGPYVRLRKIRGQLISRPKRSSGRAPYIKAKGRENWIGWCELKTEAVDEIAIELTARMINDLEADVLAVVEAESRPVFNMFFDLYGRKMTFTKPFKHVMIIDGNDERGIDVGIASVESFPIGEIRSHVDDLDEEEKKIFSRDAPEYTITTPNGNRVIVIPNHFKSKYGGNDPAGQRRRKRQADEVLNIYNRLVAEGEENIVVLGDLNDTPDSDELSNLLNRSDLQEVTDHPNFTEFEFRANNGNRGIGTHSTGNDKNKIDYLLLSPALFQKVQLGGIFRKGIWPGSRPPRWDVYPELTSKEKAASDHHAIWAEIDI